MQGAESPVQVLFDASRIIRRGGAAPTGIDRVELAYVRALADAPGFELRLLVFDALGPRLLQQQAAAELVEATARRWQASAESPRAERNFTRLAEWLQAPAGATRPDFIASPPRLRHGAAVRSAWSTSLRRPGDAWRLRRLLAARDESPAIYLNTSHGRLYRPQVSRWLEATGLGGVFFVHDLIPIEYPQYNRPGEAMRHAARLNTVCRHARRVLVNSQATRAALQGYLAGMGRRVPPISVLPLGVESRFAADGRGVTADIPYFVVLNTIEPRKNHRLLLQLWQRWVEECGAAAPRLVLLGRRGWENQAVFDQLDRSRSLSAHVVECDGLSDTQVAAVLRGARALLSPSLAEGYGLPVAEALACGTPVIASALNAHREVGGSYAEYLEPEDSAGWMQALQDYAAPRSPRRAQRVAALSAYRAPSWGKHLSHVMSLLSESARPVGSPAAT